ncbi:MAG: hypothetical protein GY850_22560 [bacterium]|nr:hypothetical protein [bacterium]
MTEKNNNFESLFNTVKRMRDELALKIHLGKAEAKEEWEELEKKWEDLQDEHKPIIDAVDESAKNVGAGLELVAEELKNGYKRIRKLL